MKVDNLPEWAKYNKKDDMVEVDPDVVYPLFLEKLGLEPTQNSLEVVRLCFTALLRKITGPKLKLRILRRERWKLANYEVGPVLDFGKQNKM